MPDRSQSNNSLQRKSLIIFCVKGKVETKMGDSIGPDVIFSERRGQSQKPEEIYKLIEDLVPNGNPLFH